MAKRKEKQSALDRFVVELDASIYMDGGYRGTTGQPNGETTDRLRHLVGCALDCTGTKIKNGRRKDAIT